MSAMAGSSPGMHGATADMLTGQACLPLRFCTTQCAVLNCEGARNARGSDIMSDVREGDISLVLLMQDNG